MPAVTTMAMTDSAMGSIMMVEAVLDIHMLKPAATLMKAPTNWRGRVPTRVSTDSAIRRCRPQRSTASAIISPPMNRKISGLA